MNGLRITCMGTSPGRYCNDPNYGEANLAACASSDNKASCAASMREGHRGDAKACITIYQAKTRGANPKRKKGKPRKARPVTRGNCLKAARAEFGNRVGSVHTSRWWHLPNGCSVNKGIDTIRGNSSGRLHAYWNQGGSQKSRHGYYGDDGDCGGKACRTDRYANYYKKVGSLNGGTSGSRGSIGSAPGDNYKNQDFFTLIWEAYELQKINGANSRNKRKNKGMMERMMSEIYKTACMIRGQRDDYYDTKKCLRSISKNYNKPRWYEHVSYASEQCDKDKTVDYSLCKRFKSNMKVLLKLARQVLYNTNYAENGCHNFEHYGRLTRTGPC